MPPPIARVDGIMQPPGRAIPMADFLKLTKMPIQIVWGDYIPSAMEKVNVGPRLSLDNRRVNVQRAKLMVEAINRHGGDARKIMLPEIGIRGNTHFPMLDLNNVQVADLLSKFLAEKRLDRR